MTECERIIKDGILPESFFEEEVLCEFTVTRERKKIWAIGLDMLVKFDEVCRTHNLKYSLGGGSLLGCIRHKGFIPWDDDIDIFMSRSDYEELKEFRSEFEMPYYLQYPGDEGYYFSFAKIRNSNTTAISWPFRYESFNQGMFLDIFPLDNVKIDDIQNNVQKINKLIAECSALMRRSNPFPDETDLKKLSLFPERREGDVILKELDCILRQYEKEETDYYALWCCAVYDIHRLTYPKILFDDLVKTNLYGYDFYIPRNYDEVLKITYGDYMKFPPVEQRGTWHNKSFFNPDVPYKDSLIQLRGQDMAQNIEKK